MLARREGQRGKFGRSGERDAKCLAVGSCDERSLTGRRRSEARSGRCGCRPIRAGESSQLPLLDVKDRDSAQLDMQTL